MTVHIPPALTATTARLPQTYESAKAALAECSRIDECHEWANKAEALASYARQADDDTLRKLADRIQARAVRRCGELLKQYNGHGNNQHGGGAVPMHTAGNDAGMSARQIKTAARVASIPADEFERTIESDAPPTVTRLAEMGTQRRAPDPPEGFAQATRLLGNVRRFAEFCRDHDAQHVAGGVMPAETLKLREMVGAIDGWLDRFVINLKD